MSTDLRVTVAPSAMDTLALLAIVPKMVMPSYAVTSAFAFSLERSPSQFGMMVRVPSLVVSVIPSVTVTLAPLPR